jgi:hypothetical protein
LTIFQILQSFNTWKTIFQLLEDAHSVDPIILEKLSAVFQLLDDAKSINVQSISDFSSAVFKLLNDAKSYDGRSILEQLVDVFLLHCMGPEGVCNRQPAIMVRRFWQRAPS